MGRVLLGFMLISPRLVSSLSDSLELPSEAGPAMWPQSVPSLVLVLGKDAGNGVAPRT